MSGLDFEALLKPPSGNGCCTECAYPVLHLIGEAWQDLQSDARNYISRCPRCGHISTRKRVVGKAA